MADADDPYSDPASGVLENRLGLSDAATLNVQEQRLSLARAGEFVRDAIVLGTRLDLAHLRAIHHHLFQDVYPWAGETRDTRGFTGGKAEPLLGQESVDYPSHDGDDPDDRLAARLDYAFDTLERDRVLRDPATGRERFVERLAAHVSEVWECHAFREGNTRTVALFTMAITRACDRPFARSLLATDGSFRDALVLAAGRSEFAPLRALLDDALDPPRRARGIGPPGAVVALDERMRARIARARDAIDRRAGQLLVQIERAHQDEFEEIDRIAAERARALAIDDAAAGDDRTGKQTQRRYDAKVAMSAARGERERFGQRGDARRAQAIAMARRERPADAALIARENAARLATRLHRDLQALVLERDRSGEARPAADLERRVNELATTLGRRPELRIALDPAARRFAQYARARSARALARDPGRGAGHSR